jgi:hypothetical protein
MAHLEPTSPEPFIDIRRPGRAGRPDWPYALWAVRYVEAVSENPLRPVASLATQFPGHSADCIRAILSNARKRGLLTAARNGVAGGDLTDKAKQVLDERGFEEAVWRSEEAAKRTHIVYAWRGRYQALLARLTEIMDEVPDDEVAAEVAILVRVYNSLSWTPR